MSNHDDSQFLDQVLQRYSNSRLEVARLSTDLKRVEDECSKLRRELEDAKRERPIAEASVAPSHGRQADSGLASSSTIALGNAKPQLERDRIVDVQQLNELQSGIAQAQESYRKSAKKLEDNEAMIRELLHSNQQLSDDRDAIRRERDECRQALKAASADNERLRASIRSLEAAARSTPAASPAKGPTYSVTALQREIMDVYQPRIAELERQLDAMTISNRKLEEERNQTQHELQIAQAKLGKIKQSKTALHDQLKGLGELTRNRAGSVHSREPSIHSTKSRVLPSPQSALSSLALPPAFGSSSNAKASGSKPGTSASAMNNLNTIDLTQAEDEDDASTPRPPYSLEVSIPSMRRKDLAQFPIIRVPAKAENDENTFSREFMSKRLGGSVQPLVVTVANQSPLGKKKGISGYLCPSIDHNPWCPTLPGHHGFMFVGLGREKDTFNQPEEKHVFVGLHRKHKDPRRFKYLGIYRAIRVPALSAEEWNGLRDHVRYTYASTTKSKNKDPRSVEAILKAYDEGELSVPCVRLQCVGFDQELYEALLRPETPELKRKTPQPESGNDSDDEGSPTKRKRVTSLGESVALSKQARTLTKSKASSSSKQAVEKVSPCLNCKSAGRECTRKVGGRGMACIPCNTSKIKCSAVERKQHGGSS